MQKKVIRVTMPDGSIWGIPADIVARNRAKYYAKKDKSTTFDDEYAYTLSDDSELLDWMANNMNWVDVKDKAVILSAAPEPNYQEGLMNGETEVVIAEQLFENLPKR